MTKIRIGTRPSKLALVQTEMVIAALQTINPQIQFITSVIKTSGDVKQNLGPLSARDKKDWIKELEEALLSEEIDLAVHSGKDVPYDISKDTKIKSVLQRADSRDVFIGKFQLKDSSAQSRSSFEHLPKGAVVGTSSLRRKAQLQMLRPDLKIIELRGNVPTRIAKLESESQYSGIVLAAAGLFRLGISFDSLELLSITDFLPAAAQGILCIQFRSARQELYGLIKKISDPDTEAALLAERAVVEHLQADCASALAVHAQVVDGKMFLSSKVYERNGRECIEVNSEGPSAEAATLGQALAERLLQKGAGRLLEID